MWNLSGIRLVFLAIFSVRTKVYNTDHTWLIRTNAIYTTTTELIQHTYTLSVSRLLRTMLNFLLATLKIYYISLSLMVEALLLGYKALVVLEVIDHDFLSFVLLGVGFNQEDYALFLENGLQRYIEKNKDRPLFAKFSAQGGCVYVSRHS